MTTTVGDLPAPQYIGRPAEKQHRAERGPLGMDFWPTPGDVVAYRTLTGPRVPALVQDVSAVTGNLRLRLPLGEIAVNVRHGSDRDQWLLLRECVWEQP